MPTGARYVMAMPAKSIGRVSPFYGNFGMLVRAYAYIRRHGAAGLRANSEHAVLNANYLRVKLRDAFTVPFDRINMHEFVCRGAIEGTGVRALDVAKRLLDYGFHPPTNYFPLIVPEALMIEPTETESKPTLDAFVAAMQEIAEEARTRPETRQERAARDAGGAARRGEGGAGTRAFGSHRAVGRLNRRGGCAWRKPMPPRRSSARRSTPCMCGSGPAWCRSPAMTCRCNIAAASSSEHLHTRAAASLFDVSHMGQIALRPRSGRVEDAARALEALVPGDIIGLAPGRQRYTLFTNAAGGVLDDLMVSNHGDHLLLVVNAARKEADEAHLRAQLVGHMRASSAWPTAPWSRCRGRRRRRRWRALAPQVRAMRFMDARAVALDGRALPGVAAPAIRARTASRSASAAERAEALCEALLRDGSVAHGRPRRARHAAARSGPVSLRRRPRRRKPHRWRRRWSGPSPPRAAPAVRVPEAFRAPT